MASSASLKETRRNKISDKNTYVKRKNGVDSIIAKMDSEIDSYIINVNNMITSCYTFYESGMKGKKKGIADDIEGEIEEYSCNTGKLSSCRSKLMEESKRCQGKIDTLNSEISTLDSQIRIAEAEEEEERRRKWNEYLASLVGGDNE